jgi:hypothetical protein
MGVACQSPAVATGGLVCKLKAKGQETGEHEFDRRLPVAPELQGGRGIVEIAGDGRVVTGLAARVSHGHPQVRCRCSW